MSEPGPDIQGYLGTREKLLARAETRMYGRVYQAEDGSWRRNRIVTFPPGPDGRPHPWPVTVEEWVEVSEAQRREDPELRNLPPHQVTASIEYVANQMAVRMRPGLDDETVAQTVGNLGGRLLRRMLLEDYYVVEFDGVGPDTIRFMQEHFISRSGDVLAAELATVMYASDAHLPNDPSFTDPTQLWGIRNNMPAQEGQDSNVVGAWEHYTTGSKDVVVGVIDTGILLNHPDLAANLWVNPGEIPGSGLDDDGNGFIDDIHGWNFFANNNNPNDDQQHGTHVAGTIGAVGNNGIGIVGMNWEVSLMALKFLGSNGSGSLLDGADAIVYATQNGAHLTNNSYGARTNGFSPDNPMLLAIQQARDANRLFVAASGNDGREIIDGQFISLPANFGVENIVVVNATDRHDQPASFSNYSATQTDIWAPGVAIYSTALDNGYRLLSGTSMAAPHVAGAAALIYAFGGGDLPYADVKAALKESVDVKPQLFQAISGGRLNTQRAMDFLFGPAYVVMQYEGFSDHSSLSPANNGNGIINNGETISLDLSVQNASFQENISGLAASVSIAQGADYVTVLTPTLSIGNLPARASQSLPDAVRVELDPAAPAPLDFVVRLTFSDTESNEWVRDIPLTMHEMVTLSGTVDAGGSPLGGATVHWSRSGPHGGSGSLTTAGNGTYNLEGIQGAYTLHVTYPSYYRTAAQTVSAPPSQSGVDFSFTQASISGLVLDNDSQPYGGTNIHYAGVLSGSTTTSGDGTFSFSRWYGQPGTVRVRASRPNAIPSLETHVTVPPDGENVNFQFTLHTISGIVRNDSGTILAGATVAAKYENGSQTTTTDENGFYSFVIESARPSANVTISAYVEGEYLPQNVSVAVPPGAVDQDFALIGGWYQLIKVPRGYVNHDDDFGYSAGTGETAPFTRALSNRGLITGEAANPYVINAFAYTPDFANPEGPRIVNLFDDFRAKNSSSRPWWYSSGRALNDNGIVAGFWMTATDPRDGPVSFGNWRPGLWDSRGTYYKTVSDQIGAQAAIAWPEAVLHDDSTLWITDSPRKLLHVDARGVIRELYRRSNFSINFVNTNGEVAWHAFSTVNHVQVLHYGRSTLERLTDSNVSTATILAEDTFFSYPSAEQDPPTGRWVWMTSISERGWITMTERVGFSPPYTFRLGVFDGETLNWLDIPADQDTWECYGANSAGDILGRLGDGGPSGQPALFVNGRWEPLQQFVPATANITLKTVQKINEQGMIVGTARFPGENADNTFLMIPPDRGMGKVGFEESHVMIHESEGPLLARVQRTDGANLPVTATWQTRDGSAVDGGEYFRQNGLLVWEDGESHDQYIEVPIINNGGTAPPKSFYIEIISNTAALDSPNQTLQVTVLTDVPGLLIEEENGRMIVEEGGAGSSMILRLTDEPTAPVTIDLTPDQQLTLAPGQVVLDAANWNDGVPVEVEAVDDEVPEGTHLGRISFALSSGDSRFHELAVEDLRVTILDNDVGEPIFAPEIIANPVSLNRYIGENMTLYGAAQGSQPMTYQWEKDGVPLINGGRISGANSMSLVITNLQEEDSGGYRLVISNAAGTATTGTGTLSVTPRPLQAPEITQQPVSHTVPAGSATALSVRVSAATHPTPEYQWYRNAEAVSGATGPDLILSNVTLAQAGDYHVVITNSEGTATSETATLTVTPASGIQAGPLYRINAGNVSVNDGLYTLSRTGTDSYQGYVLNFREVNLTEVEDHIEFTFNIRSNTSNNAARTIAWGFFDGIPVSDHAQTFLTDDWVGYIHQFGARNSSGTVGAAAQRQGTGVKGVDHVGILNYAEGTTTVNGPSVNFNPSGLHQSNLTEVTVRLEKISSTQVRMTSSFATAHASGSGSGSGSGISWSYTTASNQATVQSTFPLADGPTTFKGFAIATKGNNWELSGVTVTSNTVPPEPEPPVIVEQPESISVAEGQTASFTVVASGNPAPEYQWRKDGEVLEGATGATLILEDVSLDDEGSYTVFVWNDEGDITSEAATLTILLPPSAPTGLNATAVSDSRIDLSWTDAADPAAESFRVERSANGSSGWSTLATVPGTAYSNTGLEPDSTWYYRVIALRDGLESQPSSVASATTLPPPPEAPVITTPLADQTVTEGAEVILSVTATGHPAPTFAWTKDGVPVGEGATLNLGVVSLSDAGTYAVTATNSAGSDSSSMVLTVNEFAPPPPGEILVYTGFEGYSSSGAVNGTASPAAGDVGISDAGWAGDNWSWQGSGLSFTDANGEVYGGGDRALNYTGSLWQFRQVHVPVSEPMAETVYLRFLVHIRPQTGSRVVGAQFVINNNTNNSNNNYFPGFGVMVGGPDRTDGHHENNFFAASNSSGIGGTVPTSLFGGQIIDGVNLVVGRMRWDAGNNRFSDLEVWANPVFGDHAVPGTSIDISGLNISSLNQIAFRAGSSGGGIAPQVDELVIGKSWSDVVKGAAEPPPVEPPPAPENLVAEAVSSSRIELFWTDLSDPTDPADGFRVERSLDGEIWTDEAIVYTGAYSDTDLTVHTRYWYRVTAQRDGQESAPSAVVSARTWTELEFPDEESNGIDDRWEAEHFPDGELPETLPRRGVETPIREIFIAGLDPADENDVLEILHMDAVTGAVHFLSRAGRQYRVLGTETLGDAADWQVLANWGEAPIVPLNDAGRIFLKVQVRIPVP